MMPIVRRGRHDAADVMVEINTTPLIDVMLVLLIMLIITMPAQTDVVRMDAPVASASEPKVPPRAIDIAIDAQGRIVWNGAAVSDRVALEAHLEAVAAEAPQPALHIAPDAQAPYQAVADVLAEARQHGIAALGLVNERGP